VKRVKGRDEERGGKGKEVWEAYRFSPSLYLDLWRWSIIFIWDTLRGHLCDSRAFLFLLRLLFSSAPEYRSTIIQARCVMIIGRGGDDLFLKVERQASSFLLTLLCSISILNYWIIDDRNHGVSHFDNYRILADAADRIYNAAFDVQERRSAVHNTHGIGETYASHSFPPLSPFSPFFIPPSHPFHSNLFPILSSPAGPAVAQNWIRCSKSLNQSILTLAIKLYFLSFLYRPTWPRPVLPFLIGPRLKCIAVDIYIHCGTTSLTLLSVGTAAKIEGQKIHKLKYETK